MLRAGSRGFFMCFHPIKFPEIFSGVFQRKSTRKVWGRLDELMEHISHEFVPRR